ncbi:MAG: potassium-transporting ATPase subunit F [Nocardioidaceae bacterium]
MDVENFIALTVTVAVLVYLVVALVKPDRF